MRDAALTTASKLAAPVLLCLSLASLAMAGGCDKVGPDRCKADAKDMAERIVPFMKVQSSLTVPFDLPEAEGPEPYVGVRVFVGPEQIRVGATVHPVPASSNPVETGRFSDEMVDKIRDELSAEMRREHKMAEVLNQQPVFRFLLAVHPDVSMGAVAPMFSHLKAQTYWLGLLAYDASAPKIPERKTSEKVETLLDKLVAADGDHEIERLSSDLEDNVMGSCDIDFFRRWVDQKTGGARFDHEILRVRKPLVDPIVECGCDEVDLPAFEAALGWAMTPPHPPVVVLPSSYTRVFGDADESWSEVVKRHQ